MARRRRAPPGSSASSDVDVDTERVSVTFDPGAVDRIAINAAREAAGYPVSDSSSS
jgi:hypothetical protein